jgi:hypothetical protein
LKQAAAKAQESRVIAVALAFNPISPNGLIREFIEYGAERSLTFGQLSARFIRRDAFFGPLVGETRGDE